VIGHRARLKNINFSYWISQPEARTGKTPVLLIHGFGGTYSGLEDLSAILASRTTVIGLDLPGYGLSEPLKGRHTLSNYSRFLNDFCASTEFHKIDVVGHSFGADIAIVFAALYPERVRKLILISPVILSNRRTASLGKYYYDLVARVPRGLRHRLLHNHTLTWISDYLLFRQASERQRAKILRDDYISDHLMTDRPVIESYRSLFTTRFLKLASRIQTPTMILSGNEDQLSPSKDMYALQASIPDSTLEIIAGAGHFLPLEDPRQTADIVQQFLAQ
jgi:pimeloyl-ACP methyl ester carboxylesterase